MDPMVVFDCQDHVRNPYALVVLAARRARALNRGSSPCVDVAHRHVVDLALREISGGALPSCELRAWLVCCAGIDLLEEPDQFGGDERLLEQTSSVAKRPRWRHPQPTQPAQRG